MQATPMQQQLTVALLEVPRRTHNEVAILTAPPYAVEVVSLIAQNHGTVMLIEINDLIGHL